MGRISSLLPTRSRPERARRRVFFLAESLESRQLLSVAATHPAIAAPTANVPALVGPAVASPLASAGSTGTAATPTPQTPIVIELGQLTINFGAGASVTENLFLVEDFASNPVEAPSPAPASGVSQSLNPITGNSSSGGSTGGNGASTTSITPLTATILAGPATTNRAPVIVIVPSQPVINLSPSTIPVTTQAILATATLEEQPLQPPVLGQGFESGQTQSQLLPRDSLLPVLPTPDPVKPQEPATDYVEPYEVAPENPAPVDGAEPANPAAPTGAARDAEPLESLVLDPVNLTQSTNEAPPFAVMTPATETTTHDQYPTFSLAALVGTAAVASGGYQLVLRGSNRFNQRWLPTRRSSRGSRTL